MGKGRITKSNYQITVDCKSWTRIYAMALMAEIPMKSRRLKNGNYKLYFYDTSGKVFVEYILSPSEI